MNKFSFVQVLTYCTKQLNRFKKKMSNIEKNFKNNG